MKDKEVLVIGKERIGRGERTIINLDTVAMYDYTTLRIPIEVVRGKEAGPVLFISAAIHGDEINGVEIIKRLMKKKFIKNIKGTLIAVPIVNVFGYNSKSRYLPDRRDLNRSFPGSKKGSLASRIARIFMDEVVKKCTHGIDLHTGAIHRTNLPQVRACLDDSETKELADEFGAPISIHSNIRDGSLRDAARKLAIPTLLFEGGEALRYNESSIKIGVRGCVSVMRSINMLPKVVSNNKNKKTIIARDSYWVRAPHSGSFVSSKKLGDEVQENEVLATISDPFGKQRELVYAKTGGIVVGMSMIPLVNNGEAMFHIATFKNLERAKKNLSLLDADYDE